MVNLADLFDSTHWSNYSLTEIMNENNQTEDDSPTLFHPSPYYTESEFIEIMENQNQSFKLLSLNCQSLNAKFNELSIYLEFYRSNNIIFDCICLQETWLSDDSDTSLLKLDGYNLITKAKQCSAHGGVAIYLSDRFKFDILPMLQSDYWDGQFIAISEINTGQLRGEEKKLVIANIYRPPSNNVECIDRFTEELSQFFHNLRNFKEVIITGDFNIDLLKCKENVHISSYLDNLVVNSYLPRITFPTRLTHQHGTLIDNCFMKRSNIFQEVKAGILLKNISDHLPYFVSFNCFRNTYESKKIMKIFCGGNDAVDKLRTFIADSNVFDMLDKTSDADPNSNYEILNNVISRGISNNFNIKTVRYKKYKTKKSPWITNGILKSIKYRDKLYKSWKRENINTEAYISKKN